MDGLGRSTLCMLAICSARRRSSATSSGFDVVMDRATPVGVSETAMDAPCKFIGHIIPIPRIGMPDRGAVGVFWSPAAIRATGKINRVNMLFIIPPFPYSECQGKRDDFLCAFLFGNRDRSGLNLAVSLRSKTIFAFRKSDEQPGPIGRYLKTHYS